LSIVANPTVSGEGTCDNVAAFLLTNAPPGPPGLAEFAQARRVDDPNIPTRHDDRERWMTGLRALADRFRGGALADPTWQPFLVEHGEDTRDGCAAAWASGMRPIRYGNEFCTMCFAGSTCDVIRLLEAVPEAERARFVNAQGKGVVPIQIAWQSEIIGVLLSAGADPNGNDALRLAIERGDAASIELLLAAGADRSTFDAAIQREEGRREYLKERHSKAWRKGDELYAGPNAMRLARTGTSSPRPAKKKIRRSKGGRG
jgi:hypothetical protein